MSTPHSPEVAAEVVRHVGRLLRLWAGGAEVSGEWDCAPLLHRFEGDRAAAAGLLRGLLEGLELYRRDLWLQYAADPATVWGRWAGGELERPTYEVVKPASPGANRLRLRREAPFQPQEGLAFLAALAAAEEAGRLRDRKGAWLRGVVLDVVHAAAGAGLGTAGPEMLGPLQRLHQRGKGPQVRAGALRRSAALEQPPAPALCDCLRQLLLPAEEVEGCLTRAARLRLFGHLAEVAPPLVPRGDFESAGAAAEALRGWAEPRAASSGTLRETCAKLRDLGCFARRVRPALAGPAAGPHRQWLRNLLENFERLGELACCIVGEVLPQVEEPEPAPAEAEPVPAAPPVPPEQVTPAPPPEPEPPRKEPSPEDLALAALADDHPAAEQFQGMGLLGEELLQALQGTWPDAEEALKSLHYPGTRFRQKLLRAVKVPAEDQARLVRDAARQLADELVNKIRRLDALLPGTGSFPPPFKGPGHLGPQAREQLGQKLKALRDRVLQIMRAYGGYDEYPVAVGDSVRRHGQVLDDVSYVSGPRLRPDEIVQILEPGYVRRREDGRQELIRSPRVLVAR
jgi:hypothetical protein